MRFSTASGTPVKLASATLAPRGLALGLSPDPGALEPAYDVATSGGADSTQPPSRAGKSKLSATVIGLVPQARWRRKSDRAFLILPSVAGMAQMSRRAANPNRRLMTASRRVKLNFNQGP